MVDADLVLGREPALGVRAGAEAAMDTFAQPDVLLLISSLKATVSGETLRPGKANHSKIVRVRSGPSGRMMLALRLSG